MRVESADFKPGERIPRRHAYAPEGENVPPRLAWSDAPPGTVGFAVLVDDPDAPRRNPWVHWAAWGIPAKARSLPAAGDPVVEGKNDFGSQGWGGPLPPPGDGTHRYRFRVYALDSAPSLAPGSTADDLETAIQGHVLAQAELLGTYAR
jgi:Raf kinase inhibitor-like YbhB/YbcL family protein